jgi:hypothetical protein
MFNALWQMICRFFGLDCDPGCGPPQKPETSQPEEHNHGRPEQPQDKPDTKWTDHVARPAAAGDWFKERLRSLPDEQKNEETQSKGRNL